MENIALDLREIADKVNEEKDRQKMERHQEFVENKILPYLKELANEGEYKTDGFATPGYSTSILRDLLQEKGLTAITFKSGGTFYLSVRW